jgi:hypothetical protein
MRWFKKKKLKPEIRIRSGFLVLPSTIGNETRWLEFAKWKEKLVVRFKSFEDGNVEDYEIIEWVD